VGADDARLPSLHEIASRPHPANHAQRNGPTSNPRQPISPRARSTTACAQCCCSLSVCLVCLSVCPDPSLSTVRPACVCSTAPRSSLLDPHYSSLPRLSLLAPPGHPRQVQDSQAKRRTPPSKAIPLPAKSHSQSLRCWTHHPKVTRPPALHTSARPRPPLVRARVCLTEQASHDASLPPSLRPCLRTRTTRSPPPHPVTSSSPVHITPN
jgi:hypothetical protein